VVCVQRLSARAVLDDSPSALARAEARAAQGDESWEQWVAEYQRGEALILRLELALELGDGTGDVITASKDGFFVENDAHAPKVEQQIAELAVGDLTSRAAELRQRGHHLDLHDLGRMYVHVELDPEVRRRVRARGAPA
jgi:hypothetical protein